MGRYSIGKIAAPWTNITPPIRRMEGHPGTQQETPVKSDDSDSEESSDDDTTCSSLSGSSMTSLESTLDAPPSKTDSNLENVGHTSGWELHSGGLQSSRHATTKHEQRGTGSSALSTEQTNIASLSPAAYTSFAVQREVNMGVCENPSLDAQTQQNITVKYRELHQQVKNRGLYDCHYIEYGKEAVRYLTLFGIFIGFLRSGWYLTSACFLGLFWVFEYHSARPQVYPLMLV